MSTRELEFRDAPDLLAWARDEEGSRFFLGDKDSLCLADMESFILGAMLLEEDYHLCISDEQDKLVGLASLKNIDRQEKRAEFSIGLLPAAQGKGLARDAAEDLLVIAFLELELTGIYMYTDAKNLATQAFNDRCGFHPLPGPPPGVKPEASPEVSNPEALRWYGLSREEYLARLGRV